MDTSELMFSYSFSLDEYCFGKMKRKLPRISLSKLEPPTLLPSRPRFVSQLPDLSRHSFGPQLAPQCRSPLSAFCPTGFPPLTSNNPFYPTLRIFLPSSSSIPFRPSTCHPVHHGSLPCFYSIYAPTPPPSPSS